MERSPQRGIALLGFARVAGTERDRSGRSELLEDGTPNDLFGSFGSGLEWTGVGERYLAVCDRGPADGATSFACRWHELDVRVRPGATEPVQVELVSTTLLVDEDGRGFTGLASALVPTETRAERLDPEAIRIDTAGHVWIADEYSMQLFEFSRAGRLLRRHAPPAAFPVARPSGDRKRELADSASGRTPNRGFEGLARVEPIGAFYALAQGALLQDGGERGTHARCLEFDPVTGRTAQYAVQLERPTDSWNDLLAFGEGRFLALVRDAEKGAKRTRRSLVQLGLAGATEVSAVERLRDGSDVVPMSSFTFLDLLEPEWGLVAAGLPDKVEALALGPDLSDGRRLLLVATDNDVDADEATWVIAFALRR
ncbi:MAG: esterase-like activity of phytase family protein [Planctomycetes bacterium]|nr:esterase-like activity of phytase family protein [Planctomycetota bacterium]